MMRSAASGLRRRLFSGIEAFSITHREDASAGSPETVIFLGFDSHGMANDGLLGCKLVCGCVHFLEMFFYFIILSHCFRLVDVYI